MSEPKTSAVFVRLTKDFPAGSHHRRAGLELFPGPRPVEVEVTDDQLDLLKSDHYIEIVSDKEAKKWEDRLGEEPLKTRADVAAENEGGNTGRNYGGGNKTGSNDDDGNQDGPVELSTDLKVKELVEIATAEGVEGAEEFGKPGTKKQDIIDAIQAKRDASSDEE